MFQLTRYCERAATDRHNKSMKTTRVLLLRQLCARRRARVKQEIIETTADEQLITAVILNRDQQRVKAETLALETALQRVKAENLALETALQRVKARTMALEIAQQMLTTLADEQLIQRLTAVILDRDLQRVKAETLTLETAMQRVKAENLALETALQRVKARTLALEVAQQMLRAEALETARVKCRRMN
jgi:hypothetical protein